MPPPPSGAQNTPDSSVQTSQSPIIVFLAIEICTYYLFPKHVARDQLDRNLNVVHLQEPDHPLLWYSNIRSVTPASFIQQYGLVNSRFFTSFLSNFISCTNTEFLNVGCHYLVVIQKNLSSGYCRRYTHMLWRCLMCYVHFLTCHHVISLYFVHSLSWTILSMRTSNGLFYVYVLMDYGMCLKI